MKSIGILAQKGGAGKTTLAVHLATVSGAVLPDVDPQASAVEWGGERKSDTPLVIQVTAPALPEYLEAARAEGFSRVIIDTAPHAEADAEEVAKAVDLIMIPIRPAFLDLRAAAVPMGRRLKPPRCLRRARH
jgi:chromosome partitioning protein